MSNLHQLGLALTMYADDAEFYPLDARSPAMLENGGKSWIQALAPYCGTQPNISKKEATQIEWFFCTAKLRQNLESVIVSPSSLMGPVALAGENKGKVSYGYNSLGSIKNTLKRNITGNDPVLGLGDAERAISTPTVWRRRYLTAPSDIINPSRMISTGDQRGGTFLMGGGAMGSLRLNFDHPFESTRLADRHSMGGNFVCVDGHVEFQRPSQWDPLAPDVLRLFNRDDQSHLRIR